MSKKTQGTDLPTMEREPVALWRQAVDGLYGLLCRHDFRTPSGKAVNGEDVAFVYSTVMWLDQTDRSLGQCSFERLVQFFREHKVKGFGERKLKAIRSAGVDKVWAKPRRSGQIAYYLPSTVLTNLQGGQAVRDYTYYPLPETLHFDNGKEYWRGQQLLALVSPARGMPYSRRKIMALTGHSDDVQRDAGLVGSRNVVLIEPRIGSYLEPQFLRRNIGWFDGHEVILFRASTYPYLPKMGNGNYSSYRNHYYYLSEEEAEADPWRSRHYVVRTQETRTIWTGKTRQEAAVWKPGEKSLWGKLPFRPYPEPGKWLGGLFDPEYFYEGDELKWHV